jgi:hypothetical protein
VEPLGPGRAARPAEGSDQVTGSPRTGFDPRVLATPYRWFRISPRRIQAWREVNELPDRELMRDGRWLPLLRQRVDQVGGSGLSGSGSTQRISLMRIRLPAGSRKAQSRTPYGCSVGSWTTSASVAATFSKVPLRSLVASRIQP